MIDIRKEVVLIPEEETVSFNIQYKDTASVPPIHVLKPTDEIGQAVNVVLKRLHGSISETSDTSIPVIVPYTNGAAPNNSILLGCHLSEEPGTHKTIFLSGPNSYKVAQDNDSGIYFDMRYLIPWAYDAGVKKSFGGVAILCSKEDVVIMGNKDRIAAPIIEPSVPFETKLDLITGVQLLVTSNISFGIMAEALNIPVLYYNAQNKIEEMKAELSDYYAGRELPEVLDFSSSVTVKEMPKVTGLPLTIVPALQKLPFTVKDSVFKSIEDFFNNKVNKYTHMNLP